jgi:cytochrome P450
VHPDPLLSTLARPAPPWADEGRDDPHAWFAAVLDGPPVRYDERADVWHVFHHEPVRDFLRDATGWSTAKRLERVEPEQRIVRLLTSDPPSHTALRQHFSRAYRPRRIAAMEQSIRARVVATLDELIGRGRFDVVADLAAPITRAVVGDVIGVPGEDLEECSRRAIRDPLGTVVDDADGDRHIVLWMGAGEPENNRHFNEYFRDLLAARRIAPGDDLVSDLARMDLAVGEEDGQLNLGALLDEQFGAGQNTTVHLIATLLHELMARPGEWHRLRRDPSLVTTAIEEGLRWNAPLQARPRIAANDHRIGDVDVPAGAVGLAWVQAANLDPTVFDDPLRFDVGRAHDPHVSFGFGEHFCIGAALARLQVRIVLEEWVARVADAAPSTAPRWLPTFMMRGLVALPVEVQPTGC